MVRHTPRVRTMHGDSDSRRNDVLRRVMGTFVALILVATLLLPLASVGAQEEVDPGAPPVTAEETIPESEPPPPVEEPPIVEPQPELPPVEEPEQEAPPVDAPVTDEPAAEDPVTDEPVGEPNGAEVVAAGETEDDTEATDPVETANDESDEVDAAESTSISAVDLTCAGLLTFTIDTTNGGSITIRLYAIGDAELGEEVIASPSPGATQVQFSFENESLPDSIGATIVDDAYHLIGSTTVSGCAGDDGEEEPVGGVPSVISSVSLSCDGTLTFTIDEAGDETLIISFTNLHAPAMNQDMGSVSFPVAETGTFQVSIGVDEGVDVFQADISSALASGIIGQAAAYGCVTGEEQALGYGISDMTVSCTGAITFTIGAVEGGVSIQLFDSSTNPRTLRGSAGLGYIIDGGGEERTIDFHLPGERYDSLVAHAWSHNDWAPLDIAYANNCLDAEEPELPEIQNLLVTCDGLVTFDLVTTEEVTLDIAINVPATAPGFHADTQLTAGTGPQRVQFDVPDGLFATYATNIDFDFESLGYATVTGCQTQLPNTRPGADVVVEVGGGVITFDEVLEVGHTTVTVLDPGQAPPVPAGYVPDSVILLDISTTAVFEGTVQICLPMGVELEADAANVRLLHFENGAWVDITTSVSGSQVCGVTSSFSPFAIVKLSGQEPESPGEPGGPHEPGHHGPKPGAHHAHQGNGTVSGGVSLTSLPNTGSGAHSEGNGAQTVQILLAALALLVAGGLRLSSTQTRGERSR